MSQAAATQPESRRRISVVGVLGEVLVTAGVLVLLFLGWQLWLNDLIVGGRLRDESVDLSQRWEQDYVPSTPTASPSPGPSTGTASPPPVRPASGEPPVVARADDTDRFALLLVPRFGDDYYRPIAEGISSAEVLNRGELGRYPQSELPGEAGNFAIAAHRKAYGGNLERIGELRVGDPIVVETADGWYSYRFRNLEFVPPSGIGVLDPVPQVSGAAPGDRYITLTSCNPFFSTAERIIAYGIFDGWYPRSGGPPDEVAAAVGGAG